MASSEHARLAAWVVGVVLPVVKAVSRVALVTAALLALAVVTAAYITASAAPSAAGTSATGGTAAASTTAAATAATAAATTAAAATTSTAAAGSNSGAAAAASTTSATAAASTTSAAAGSASAAVGAGKSSDKRKRTDELDSEHAGLTYARYAVSMHFSVLKAPHKHQIYCSNVAVCMFEKRAAVFQSEIVNGCERLQQLLYL
jgi:hypothetical protein